MKSVVDKVAGAFVHPEIFITSLSCRKLRDYQKQPAAAIIDSVVHSLGRSFVIVFPRQSGKNELQAQIETFLLTLWSKDGGEMVKVSPTWKPQSLNAMRRLQRVLSNNLLVHNHWRKEAGYIYRIGGASITFLSGSATANIVGATASKLLEVDEAQDVSIAKFDKEIAPMAASTNATRVFWGTAWTARTLLARELRLAQEAEKADGTRRAWVLTAAEVAAEAPDYGSFVADQVRRLGRNHPSVKTQFFSEEIDAEGSMFPPERRALMAGTHHRLNGPNAEHPAAHLVGSEASPHAGHYAALIDVAGEDEGISAEPGSGEGDVLSNPKRDATALTVVQVDLTGLSDSLVGAPTYRVVSRKAWTGRRHSQLYGILRALVEHWRLRYVVIDATGVGAGLASFLDRAFPGKVIPFTFNIATKSELGWGFLAAIETGRFKDYVEMDAERATFNLQLAHCQMEVLPGPQHHIKWGVPGETRDPASGELIHDDFVMSAALCAVLDRLPWSIHEAALVIRATDPLTEMDREGF